MGVSISISIAQNSQSVTNNTSNVTVTVKASWTYGSHNAVVDANGVAQAKGWLKIDGTNYNFNSTFNTGETTTGSQTIYTKTVNVGHASDGKKTLSCSASYTTGVSAGTVTASASKDLTTIPRKSSLSASNGTLGTAQTLTVTKKSSSFTHKITYKCGTETGIVCAWNNPDTSVSWIPPASLAYQNTTGTSVSVTFTITTYSGNTNIGSDTKTISCTIPNTDAFKPKVTSITVSDETSYKGIYGAYVKSLSKFKVTVNASGVYGSTIKTYSTKANGSTYTTSAFTTGTISSSGDLTITATVTDSRGRTGSSSTTVQVINYSLPKITMLVANRDSSGDNIFVTFSATTTSLNSKNNTRYTLEYKKTGTTSYTPIDTGDILGNYTVSNKAYMFAADQASSYDIRLTIADGISSTSKSTVGPTVSKLFSVLKKGVGIAFGKIAEITNYLDVAFYVFCRKDIVLANERRIWGVLNTGNTSDPDNSVIALEPLNSSGNTTLGWGNYNRKSGNTNIYGHDVSINVSNVPTATSFRPYVKPGDTVTFSNFRTSGYVTNSGKNVVFLVPFAERIIGGAIATVTSNDGLVLRQGNTYTHGSAASTFVHPVSYSGDRASMCGVYITAVFENTDNVINNNPIGVYWSGTITFT